MDDQQSLKAMLRPPVNRSMRVLDRSFFRKRVPLSAAQVFELRSISRIRNELERSKEILKFANLPTIQPIPTSGPAAVKCSGKCIMLRPGVKQEERLTWSEKLKSFESSGEVRVIPYALDLTYENWNYLDIMSSILPENEQDEIPVGFSITGHIAHLNLRDQYLPYKTLIAEVLMDKNPAICTVINKTDLVGTSSEFRTFGYELLAGDPNMNVEIAHEGCILRFDYSKTYWNSRLQTEHHLLAKNYFKPGQAICDVMAGVGPFAIPAGKRRCYVWANDLNPHSFTSMSDSVKRNKVSHYVRVFNEDGHNFISHAISSLSEISQNHPPPPKTLTTPSRSQRRSKKPVEIEPPPSVPPTFSHFIMNLPATASTFLPSFIGCLAAHRHLYEPFTVSAMPLIHVYIFSAKASPEVAAEEICFEISTQLGHQMRVVNRRDGYNERAVAPPYNGADVDEAAEEGNIYLFDVRDVAPKKSMYRATFRLPRDVAFKQ